MLTEYSQNLVKYREGESAARNDDNIKIKALVCLGKVGVFSVHIQKHELKCYDAPLMSGAVNLSQSLKSYSGKLVGMLGQKWIIFRYFLFSYCATSSPPAEDEVAADYEEA